MTLIRQAKGTLAVDKQVLHWIVYVFTSEQVYSNDGSKVIIYGGHESQYSGQAKGSLNVTGQVKGSSNFNRQSKGSSNFTRED